jgi:protease II
VSEFLIANHYTSSDGLALLGENHGGVLIGSAVNKRPDLFKCSAVNSGLFDVLNCIKMTLPRRIINQNDDVSYDDYKENERSNSDESNYSFASTHSMEIDVTTTEKSSKKNEIDCSWKQEYFGENSSNVSITNISPLQLISNEVKDCNYPAILLTGSIKDYPVCFNHSLLYISQLQQLVGVKNTQSNPLLLLSSDKLDGDINKGNEIQADIFSFIITQIVKE